MNLTSRWRHSACTIVYKIHRISKRNILSQFYSCEDTWQRRLESPLLNSIKMSQYFNTVDKKFVTKRLASGVDIDLFANCVKNEDELEELEHLLYRFRKTKRAAEMMDSTICATARALIKHGDKSTLFRVLENRDSYGIFPDHHSYNMLMDHFLNQKLYKEAARIAVLMMLQEDLTNPISQILGLYSCQKFLSECSIQSLTESFDDKNKPDEKVEAEEDEDDVSLMRVPFLRNPWFDDHFHITNPNHLIGKTFYLIGREMNNDVLGRTYKLIGLAMYEKWEKAIEIVQAMINSDISPSVLNDGVEKVKECLNVLPEDDQKTKENLLDRFEDLFNQLEKQGKIAARKVTDTLEAKLCEITELEKRDIELQKLCFENWESERQAELKRQDEEIDKEQRLKAIQDKKEYLFWKEKLLFFFENEDKILDELKEVDMITEEQKSKKKVVDTYEPPLIINKKPIVKTRFMKLTQIKKL